MVATSGNSELLLNDSILPKEPEITENLENAAPIVDDPLEVGETGRTDVEEPRISSPFDATETTGDMEMTDDLAKEVLEQYAFGAGMRMYARSLALAELAEKEKAVADKLNTAPTSMEAPDITDQTKSMIVVPSAKSVISFDSVRSEISRIVLSFGSRDMSSACKSEKNDNAVADAVDNDDDDVLEVMTFASEETKARGQTTKGYCGADDALVDLFRQAEVWAAATYESMKKNINDKEMPIKGDSKKWWSFLFPTRKNHAVETEHLTLGEESANVVDTVPISPKTQWWATVLCEPVIIEEQYDDDTTLRDDDTRATLADASPTASVPSASTETKWRWGWPFSGETQKESMKEKPLTEIPAPVQVDEAAPPRVDVEVETPADE
jgi:hypothetical protein